MNSKEIDFTISALTEHNPFMNTEDFMDWFVSRKEVHSFKIEQIPFRELDKWSFEQSTGNLVHDSGRFFTIEGIWVNTNFGPVPEWSQPIINQPEFGILGILTKKFDGVLCFLMQTKMEPGNINMVQLAPTVQATRSNYTRAHKGTTPPYLEYFLDRSDSKVLVDVLQSEQGARFLRKRNRNIILETNRDVPVSEDYCWLTLGQIQKLIKYDNLLNMDARTVLSCIPFVSSEMSGLEPSDVIEDIRKQGTVNIDFLNTDFDDFQTDILKSILNTRRSLHDEDEIISWFTEAKIRYELDVERIPLKFVKNWNMTDFEIVHDEGKYFSILAVAVEADNREVNRWTQPLIKPQQKGIIAYILKNIDGVLHFLVQAKVEPGNFDVVEMAPTIQCITGSYMQAKCEERPPFLDYLLNVSHEKIRLSSMQSEEGGRFFHEENKNMIIEVGDEFPIKVPDNYIWMTMNQIKKFIKYNNFINVAGRCLLPSLGFI